MCHPEQLISRVVVVVKDLNLQPQFLFMRAHLEKKIQDNIQKGFNYADLSVIYEEVSPVRIEAIFLSL